TRSLPSAGRSSASWACHPRPGGGRGSGEWRSASRPRRVLLAVPRAVEVLPAARLLGVAKVIGHPAGIRVEIAARGLLRPWLRLRLLLPFLDDPRQVARVEVLEETHELAEIHVGDPLVAADDQHVLVVVDLRVRAEVGGAGDDGGVVAEGID